MRAHDEADERGLTAVVPFRFACHRCGHCCSGGAGFVWLADGEVDALANALGLSVAEFARRHVRTVIDPASGAVRDALREDGASAEHGGRCTLLAGANTCTAYGARPAHCREFPYWPRVLAEPAAFEAARATCPGIAVVAPADVRARAHAELAELYALAGPPRAEHGCCLDADRTERVYATALEADYAVEMRAAHTPTTSCRLGAGAPLACRVASAPDSASDALFARVRSIERAHAYPAAYGELAQLLRARGVEARARVDEERS